MSAFAFRSAFDLFPGCALVPVADAARAIGLAEKTARNQLSAGKFPLKTVSIGRRRLVPVADLDRYLREVGALPPLPPEPEPSSELEPERRPRGRPRKTSFAQGGVR